MRTEVTCELEAKHETTSIKRNKYKSSKKYFV